MHARNVLEIKTIFFLALLLTVRARFKFYHSRNVILITHVLTTRSADSTNSGTIDKISGAIRTTRLLILNSGNGCSHSYIKQMESMCVGPLNTSARNRFACSLSHTLARRCMSTRVYVLSARVCLCVMTKQRVSRTEATQWYWFGETEHKMYERTEIQRRVPVFMWYIF